MLNEHADRRRLNRITGLVIRCALRVHEETGPGLLESVYEALLAHELREMGLQRERQVPLPIVYRGLTLEEGYRADILVEGLVIVEIKSVEALAPVHFKQVLTYLRLSERRVGLLINFNETSLRDGIRRIVNRF